MIEEIIDITIRTLGCMIALGGMIDSVKKIIALKEEEFQAHPGKFVDYTEMKPCPRCGSNIITYGTPFTIRTPKFVRFIRRLHGVTCLKCGCYRPTKILWNWRVTDHV